MNDGELKTRITCQTTFRSTPHGQEDIINLEGIKQIIDEAKKDFPEWEQDRESLDFNITNTIDYAIKAEAWFQKWFGSE